MRIAVGSDLHLDQNVLNCPYKNKGNAEVLILAGDICDMSNIRYDSTHILEPSKRVLETIDWFQNISREFPLILWVFGNHEYYEGDLTYSREAYKKFLSNIGIFNIVILENEFHVIDDVEFVGATLWTDFKNRDPQVMWDCQRGMSDYRFIKIDDRRLTTEDIADKYNDSVNYITQRIKTSSKELVIITHHQPTWFNARLEYGNTNLNYAYYNELGDMILDHSNNIPYWISGHTHTNREEYMENTRLVTNCRGYYGFETMANNFNFKYYDV